MKKPIEYIKQALKLYFQKENFIFFAKIMAVLTIISTSFSIIAGYVYPVDVYENLDFSNYLYTGGFLILSIFMIVFGIFTRSTTLISVMQTGGDIKNIFLTGWNKAWKYFLATFFVGLVVGLGAILLIIPGIIFGIWYAFTIFLVFEKNLSVFDAMKQSKAMVRGKFWKVLGRFTLIAIFAVLVTLVLSYIPYVGSILISFLAPLYLLPGYLLYKDISSIAASSISNS